MDNLSIDINNICYTCLSTEQDLNQIENTHEEYELFKNMFQKCTCIEVSSNETIIVCNNCVKKINDYHHFLNLCMESYQCIKNYKENNTAANMHYEVPFESIEEIIITAETSNSFEEKENIEENIENKCLNSEAEIDFIEDSCNGTTDDKNCTICNILFDSVEKKIIHEKANHLENYYKCGECLKQFHIADALTEHIHTNHKKKTCPLKARYVCARCEKSYTSAVNLKIHVFNHMGVRPYECKFCDKTFTKRCTLNAHETLHTGVRKHICDLCDKGFTSAYLLNRHKLMHTGEKTFKCEICIGSFISARDLKIHVRTHTGEKPYPCHTCGKSFTRNTHLTIHKRIHTGEKPYECKTCGKSFAQIGDLLSHKRIHSGEKPFKCPICPKQFTQSTGARQHLKRHVGLA